MRVYKVIDLSNSDLNNTNYDLAIFASGYERRCKFVSQKILNNIKIKQSIIFGYKDGRKSHYRLENDNYFKENRGNITIIDKSPDTTIYERLRSIELNLESNVFRILVDYSTMSRLWYSSILNWIRFLPDIPNVEIDFIYSFGQYKGEFSPLIIESILSLPGYEGSPIFDAKTVAIFGLGFDGLATLGALDQLEPNVVYGYLANPGASDSYPEKSKNCNKVFIDSHASKLLELPISSVEVTYGNLTELISPHRGKDNIVLIPMGPKPHVLAAMILCMRFEKEASCLRIKGMRQPIIDVEAEGRIVITRVVFKQDE